MLLAMPDITRILSQLEEGDPQAAEKLLPLVYDELRKLAAIKLAQEKPGQTLQATALVHEAFLRLIGSNGTRNGVGQQWNGQGHFFAAAAEAMRRILIEQARRKNSAKGGGYLSRVELVDHEIEAPRSDVDLLALNEALERLKGIDRRKADLVNMRFFAGLTLHEAAQALGISDATADSDWAYAKAW